MRLESHENIPIYRDSPCLMRPYYNCCVRRTAGFHYCFVATVIGLYIYIYTGETVCLRAPHNREQFQTILRLRTCRFQNGVHPVYRWFLISIKLWTTVTAT